MHGRMNDLLAYYKLYKKKKNHLDNKKKILQIGCKLKWEKLFKS
jgi:hypothetical protein